MSGLYCVGISGPVLVGLVPGQGSGGVDPQVVIGCQHTIFLQPILLLGQGPLLKQHPLLACQGPGLVAEAPPQERRKAQPGHQASTRR